MPSLPTERSGTSNGMFVPWNSVIISSPPRCFGIRTTGLQRRFAARTCFQPRMNRQGNPVPCGPTGICMPEPGTWMSSARTWTRRASRIRSDLSELHSRFTSFLPTLYSFDCQNSSLGKPVTIFGRICVIQQVPVVLKHGNFCVMVSRQAREVREVAGYSSCSFHLSVVLISRGGAEILWVSGGFPNEVRFTCWVKDHLLPFGSTIPLLHLKKLCSQTDLHVLCARGGSA